MEGWTAATRCQITRKKKYKNIQVYKKTVSKVFTDKMFLLILDSQSHQGIKLQEKQIHESIQEICL